MCIILLYDKDEIIKKQIKFAKNIVERKKTKYEKRCKDREILHRNFKLF